MTTNIKTIRPLKGFAVVEHDFEDGSIFQVVFYPSEEREAAYAFAESIIMEFMNSNLDGVNLAEVREDFRRTGLWRCPGTGVDVVQTY